MPQDIVLGELGQHANAERQITKAKPILLEMNAVPASTAAINKNCKSSSRSQLPFTPACVPSSR
jgi:hypothetical protein